MQGFCNICYNFYVAMALIAGLKFSYSYSLLEYGLWFVSGRA